MMFVTLELTDTQEKNIDMAYAREIVTRWQVLLSTGGVKVNVAVTPDEANKKGKTAIFTQEDGKILDTKEFVLDQPECDEFKWNNKVHMIVRRFNDT